MRIIYKYPNFEYLAIPEFQGIIGINNRDLHTFNVDIETSLKLIQKIPEKYVVIVESGIKSCDDIVKLRTKGVDGFLIGEALVKSGQPGAKLRQLLEAH